jgi:CubicO group peptidase (beta-lactamase class C family)
VSLDPTPALREVLDCFLADGTEVGAGLCVIRNGQVVTDLSVGTRNEAGDPWTSDTLVMTYSAAKPFAALTVLTLVADGLVGLDQPVADVWPNFGAHGKGATTVRQALSHQAGVPTFPDAAADVPFDDTDTLLALLADAPPQHPPGTIAEHALTYGHLCDGIVRHAAGERLVDRFARIAAGCGWDLHLSLDTAEHGRTADVVGLDPAWPGSYLDDPAWGPALQRPPGLLDPAVINSERWRVCSFPAISLHASARGLAAFYGDLLAPSSAVARLIGDDLVAEYTSVQAAGPDLVRGQGVTWTLGFDLDAGDLGMGGIGGSSAWVAPHRGYACAYVTRGLAGHERDDAVWTFLNTTCDAP